MNIALEAFSKGAKKHLTPAQFEYCVNEACVGGGSVLPGWIAIIGYEPDDHNHYEIRVTDWMDKSCPQNTRTWVRILVSRDRASDLCEIQWLVEPGGRRPQANNQNCDEQSDAHKSPVGRELES